ncbi:MAG TPA: cell division protein CrgA [Nocardioides sp.]|nr:cell division protein CrgA [Nocardioides sp.]
MSKSTPRTAPGAPVAPDVSLTRTIIAAAMVVLGLAWMIVYVNVAQDGQSLTWMGDLRRWNFLIGFGLVFLGLTVAGHPSTPLGRGRGVVVGMLGAFLLGLVWIVVYYITGSTIEIPVMKDLDQYNLVVGIGFMAVGFVYATKWE